MRDVFVACVCGVVSDVVCVVRVCVMYYEFWCRKSTESGYVNIAASVFQPGGGGTK